MQNTVGKGSAQSHCAGLEATLYGLSTIALSFPLRPEDRAAGKAHASPVQKRGWLSVEDRVFAVVGFVAGSFIKAERTVIRRTPNVKLLGHSPIMTAQASEVSP